MIIKPKKGQSNKPKAQKVTPRKKKTTEKIKVSKPTDDATRVYHVAKREDGKWQVKFAGGEKAIKLFDNQMEAIVYVRKMSKNQKGKMLVHNSKGKNKGRIKAK